MNYFNWTLISQWTLLVGIILALIYAMKVIKGENKSFHDESYLMTFGSLKIPIPNWWAIKKQNEQEVEFYRQDTRYDWYARFKWVASNKNINLEEIFDQYLGEEQIAFDPDVIVETKPQHLFQDKKVISQFGEFLRVEGQATEKINERIYIDIILMRQKNANGYFSFISKSSVLNGGIEGPYFEEALRLLSIDDQAP
jgi:hypothetical protein